MQGNRGIYRPDDAAYLACFEAQINHTCDPWKAYATCASAQSEALGYNPAGFLGVTVAFSLLSFMCSLSVAVKLIKDGVFTVKSKYFLRLILFVTVSDIGTTWTNKVSYK